jgi:hypothetical protein
MESGGVGACAAADVTTSESAAVESAIFIDYLKCVILNTVSS